MIRLHTLIENMKQGNIDRVSQLEANVAHAYNTDLFDTVDSLKCFDIGEVEKYDGTEWKYNLVILPYQNCWFEFNFEVDTNARMSIGVKCDKQGNKGIRGIAYDVTPNHTPCILGAWVASADDMFKNTYVMPNHEYLGELMIMCRNLIFGFLTLLHSKNVKRVRTDPAAALQRARSKRGKLPLHSYWTLDLTLAKEEIIREVLARQGVIGRNSPREHPRRAHPRFLKDGRQIDVKAATVGRKSMGTVDKDYAVKLVN